MQSVIKIILVLTESTSYIIVGTFIENSTFIRIDYLSTAVKKKNFAAPNILHSHFVTLNEFNHQKLKYVNKPIVHVSLWLFVRVRKMTHWILDNIGVVFWE